jgi:hypothetical protein
MALLSCISFNAMPPFKSAFYDKHADLGFFVPRKKKYPAGNSGGISVEIKR